MTLATNRSYQSVGDLPLSNSYGTESNHRIYPTVVRCFGVCSTGPITTYRCFLLPICHDNYGHSPKGEPSHQKKTLRDYREHVFPLSNNYVTSSRLPQGIGCLSVDRIYRRIYEAKSTYGVNESVTASPQIHGGVL